MTKKLLVASTAILAITLTSPAFADEKDQRIRALEAQLQALIGEVQALKAESAQEKAALKAQIKEDVTAEIETDIQAAITQATTQATAEAVQAVQAIQPAAGAGSGGDIKELRFGDVTVKPFGRVQTDFALIDDDVADLASGAEIRRARFGFKGELGNDFGYKIQLGFANDQADIEDAYLSYDGIQSTKLRLGHFKPEFIMEEAESSNDTIFAERGQIANAFAPGRALGVAGSTYGDHYFAAAGVFNDDAGTQSDDDEALDVTGRLAFAPINDDQTTLHIGGAASYRVPDQSNDTFDFDGTAGNAIQGTDSVSARITDADDAVLYGLEAAAAFGPFSLQGEYAAADVSLNTGSDLRFDGYYAAATYTLTGEKRPYSIKKGAFKRIKPEQPFSLKDKTWGAWEIAGRYEHLDLTDGAIAGGELDAYTLGLNWYPNNNIRFIANYINADTDEDGVTPNDNPEVYLLRGQFAF